MKEIITITSRALTKLKQIGKNYDTKTIFIGLKNSGCNGFEYEIQPTKEIDFQKGDEIIKKDGIDIHVCGKSIMYLLGSNLDWEKTIMNEGFKFNNPNANSMCGCGKSFNPGK